MAVCSAIFGFASHVCTQLAAPSCMVKRIGWLTDVLTDAHHMCVCVRMSFVDLAGSERTAKTTMDNVRVKESGNINKSLMTLRNCISTVRYNNSHRYSNLYDSVVQHDNVELEVSQLVTRT